MALACSVPVDAGRAGVRLQTLCRVIPGLGLATVALLLSSGPPSWAAPDPTGFWRLVQAGFSFSAVFILWRALRGWISSRGLLNRPNPPNGPIRPNPLEQRILHLGDDGLARLSGTLQPPSDAPRLRLARVSTLPGLIVVVLAPISEAGTKLFWRDRVLRRGEVLIIAEDALSQDQWRRLHVWLLWVRRAASAPGLAA
jgi:hypothetical protein